METELLQGSGGVFDVKADGRLVFSKHSVGRFPEEGELIQLLQSS